MSKRRSCRIALIADDPGLADTLLATLRGAGHACRRFRAGAAALGPVADAGFDVLLLDRALPDIAPATMMLRLRGRIGYSLPVIAIAPDDSVTARIAALDDGADECLARSVPAALLLAHVAAAARRHGSDARIESSIGHLRFRPEGMRVDVAERPVVLTAKEYALALMMCRNIGKPLDREHILATIWGGEVPPLTRTLDVHISRLRAKLELRPDRGFHLAALYGRGYRLDYADETAAGPVPAPRLTPPLSALPSARPSGARQPQAR